MVNAYCIQATVTRPEHGTRQVPTFYLLPDVQGIVSEEHAVKIAKDMLGGEYVEVHASATLVELMPNRTVRQTIR